MPVGSQGNDCRASLTLWSADVMSINVVHVYNRQEVGRQVNESVGWIQS